MPSPKGWTAKANAPGPQNEYEVLPANFVLRAIPLAAGRHHFTLEYTPKGLKEGRAISLAALLCLLAFGAKGRSPPCSPGQAGREISPKFPRLILSLNKISRGERQKSPHADRV